MDFNFISTYAFLWSLLASLVSCGTEATNQTQSTSTATGSSIQYQPTEPKQQTTTVQYEKVGEQYALALDNQSELPVCEKANDRQLAYIRNTDKFFSCENSVWTEINVQGQVGTQGPAGPKGDKGDPGQPVDPNQWSDPITEKQWLIGGPLVLAAINYQATTICSNGWRLGSDAEVISAINHGLLNVAHTENSAITELWTSDGALDSSGIFQRQAETFSGQSLSIAVNPAVVCVKVPQ